MPAEVHSQEFDKKQASPILKESLNEGKSLLSKMFLQEALMNATVLKILNLPLRAKLVQGHRGLNYSSFKCIKGSFGEMDSASF